MTINISNPDPTPATDDLEQIEDLKGGIYLLYDQDYKLLYVGQSDNMKERISQQLSQVAGAKFFAVCYIADPYQREIYETSMINDLKPAENKEKVFYTK
jgi:excinuclease UvrABC nuclease subunit